MRKLWLLLALWALPALAQNGRYDNIAIGPKGIIPFATISVCTQPASTANPPCTPLANLCSSLTDLTCTQPNPISADELGNFHFYAKFSTEPYTILIYGPRVAAPYGIMDILLAGGGGGGGGSGTPFQVTRFTSTGVGIQDSTGNDNPANGPTEWVSGLSVESAFLGVKTPNSPNGTALNLLLCADLTVTSITEATTCPTSTTVAFAVADNGASNTGNVVGARLGLHSIIFDNQTTVNHCAVPSSSVAGEATDAGTSCPAGQEQIGRITTANTGAGTASQVDLRAWDVVNSASTGSVSNCGSANSNAYYATSGNLISCDPFFTDDGAGHPTAKSLGLTDTSHAGFWYETQGAAPLATPANSTLFFVGTSISTPNAFELPVASGAGDIGKAWGVSSSSTDSNGNPIDVMGLISVSGGSTHHGLSFTIGQPGGTVLTASASTTDYITVPFSCTVASYNLAIDAGTITVKFWKIATGTAIPTSSNSINTSGVGIASGTAIHSTTLTDFTTTTVTAYDIMAMNVSAVSGTAYINGVLECN